MGQFYTTCKYIPLGKTCRILRSNHYLPYHQLSIWKHHSGTLHILFSVFFEIQTLALQCVKQEKNLQTTNVYFKKPQNTKKFNIEVMTKKDYLKTFKTPL